MSEDVRLLHERLEDLYVKEGLFFKGDIDRLAQQSDSQNDPSIRRGKSGELILQSYIKLVLNRTPITNIYIPDKTVPYFRKGHYAEIDCVFLDVTGVFLIEFKNYAGTVNGTKDADYWNVSYDNGSSYQLYNPIKQISYHEDKLTRFLQDYFTNAKNLPIVKCVIFSDTCTLNVKESFVYTQLEFLTRCKYVLENAPKCITAGDLRKLSSLFNEYSDSSNQMNLIHRLILNGELEHRHRDLLDKLKI